MQRISESNWADVDLLRSQIAALTSEPDVQSAGQKLAALFVRSFSSIVLARLFIVQPFSALPTAEQDVGAELVKGDPRLTAKTQVLSLLGTDGREEAWKDRRRSQGHRAIPLLDRSFVQNTPMIAKLLSDLQVDLANLDTGAPIATRRMLGGTSSTFFIADASSAVDAQARKIIPAQDFVEKHGVRTVFGMGGAYADGALVVAIFFTDELLDRLLVDRFPSLISNFRMATSEPQTAGRIYRAD